jgi:hypothetical protein
MDIREGELKKGAHSTSTSAHEVEKTHPRVELDTSSEEDNRGKKSGTVWRRRVLDRMPPDEVCTEDFG